MGWYDFFIGGFLYGEEHWTCIAAEALVPYKQKASYRDFCDGLARFWGQSQAHPGDYPDQQTFDEEVVGTPAFDAHYGPFFEGDFYP